MLDTLSKSVILCFFSPTVTRAITSPYPIYYGHNEVTEGKRYPYRVTDSLKYLIGIDPVEYTIKACTIKNLVRYTHSINSIN